MTISNANISNANWLKALEMLKKHDADSPCFSNLDRGLMTPELCLKAVLAKTPIQNTVATHSAFVKN